MPPDEAPGSAAPQSSKPASLACPEGAESARIAALTDVCVAVPVELLNLTQGVIRGLSGHIEGLERFVAPKHDRMMPDRSCQTCAMLDILHAWEHQPPIAADDVKREVFDGVVAGARWSARLWKFMAGLNIGLVVVMVVQVVAR